MDGSNAGVEFRRNVVHGLGAGLTVVRRHRWFDGTCGLLIGRSAAPAPTSPSGRGYAEALRAALRDLSCPVLYGIDIGHQPPQFTLINGAVASMRFKDGGGSVDQMAVA